MKTTFELDEKEARQVFNLLKRELEYRVHMHYTIPDDPLYDRLAEHLGENTLRVHVESLILRHEEEAIDEWREAVEEAEEA